MTIAPIRSLSYARKQCGSIMVGNSWGTSMFDYDNDGDTDITFQGGIEAAAIIDATNPGAILQNQNCSASFTYDAQASSVDHNRRNVHGRLSF